MGKFCSLYENCPFFLKYKDKHQLACSAFIHNYCENNGDNCARLKFRQENNCMPPADLLPTGKTEISIPQEILDKTTKCINKLTCLTNNVENLCKVTKQIQNELYFIACLHDKDCPYMDVFGKTKLCTCPVRREIYNLYEV
ncbi:MAG: hypothetical protein ABIG64_05200 [Candidatus Omnitrophota bacterium]